MNKHFAEFNELTNNAGNYLEQKLGYALKTSHTYRRIWRQVREFMFSNGINQYGKSAEEQFLRFRFENKGWKDLTVNQRITHNGLKMLSEYQQTGSAFLHGQVNTRWNLKAGLAMLFWIF